ncbi:P-loop containing nucleoside triphosphate hydrolase protein [Boletus edulis BED1]|uniref:P-loop containing nucleoside triphosphate hydrolase protein n=1 Tax=Boletus edulis BED1 TaxID=1328754 RepID=A0AAD4BVL6_BOLED|nr:P-loop containing nucleoside triphosphate hydrolase protein [Boletus edulis BED1]
MSNIHHPAATVSPIDSSVLGHLPPAMRCSSPTSERPIRRNVLIVGDVGVGKSSLVNLISGKVVATASRGVKSCTLQSQEYVVTFGGVEFALHDTAGLHEAQDNMNTAEYLGAIHQAYALISRLEQSGGINLLLFCMKGGRINITTQQTYYLFAEVFCNRQVPVVIAVTHLEDYACMEQWWNENEGAIKEYGFRSHGHACITTTRGYENMFSAKYEVSREVIRNVLMEYSGQVAWKQERATWVKRLVLHMRSWLPPRLAKQLDSGELRKKLVKQCGLSAEDAKSVTQKMEARGMSTDAPEEDKSRMDEKSRRASLPVVLYRRRREF